MKRVCKTCGEAKEETTFYKNEHGNIRLHCPACIYKKKKAGWTPEEKQKQLEYRLNWRRNIKTKLVEHFGGVCSVCNTRFPTCVFEFHHLDPNSKEKQVAHMGSFKRCLEEAKKCILLCSNCHRILHYSSEV